MKHIIRPFTQMNCSEIVQQWRSQIFQNQQEYKLSQIYLNMDQHYFQNSLPNPPGQQDQNQQQSRPNLNPVIEATDPDNPNQIARKFTELQLFSALIQINRMLEHDLAIQFQKNRILVELLCSRGTLSTGNLQPQPSVKEQQFDKVVQYHDDYQNQEEPNSAQKQKKLTTNDTKNISKNFGKAIITFIQKNPLKIGKILQTYKIDVQKFSNQLKQRKKKLISIKQLRSLWLETQFQYAKPFREISYLFLRKACFKYIFGSRIADYAGHLKYRKRMVEALQCPQSFTSIKQ